MSELLNWYEKRAGIMSGLKDVYLDDYMGRTKTPEDIKKQETGKAVGFGLRGLGTGGMLTNAVGYPFLSMTAAGTRAAGKEGFNTSKKLIEDIMARRGETIDVHSAPVELMNSYYDPFHDDITLGLTQPGSAAHEAGHAMNSRDMGKTLAIATSLARSPVVPLGSSMYAAHVGATGGPAWKAALGAVPSLITPTEEGIATLRGLHGIAKTRGLGEALKAAPMPALAWGTYAATYGGGPLASYMLAKRWRRKAEERVKQQALLKGAA